MTAEEFFTECVGITPEPQYKIACNEVPGLMESYAERKLLQFTEWMLSTSIDIECKTIDEIVAEFIKQQGE